MLPSRPSQFEDSPSPPGDKTTDSSEDSTSTLVLAPRTPGKDASAELADFQFPNFRLELRVDSQHLHLVEAATYCTPPFVNVALVLFQD